MRTIKFKWDYDKKVLLATKQGGKYFYPLDHHFAFAGFVAQYLNEGFSQWYEERMKQFNEAFKALIEREKVI